MPIHRRLAVCGLTAALSLVLMLLGSFLGLGTYVVPMIVGLCLTVIGNKYGPRTHLKLWFAVSVLSIILVPEVEQSLMFVLIFGLYPVLYPAFQKLPFLLRIFLKFLYFNIVVVLVETLVILVFAPEFMDSMLAIFLLILGNLIFFCYDHLIPRADFLMQRFLGKVYDKL